MAQKRILFLCTGNSCRSQIAEALVNHFIRGEWTAYSAGVRPVGFVHPMALRVLEEIGIHHQGESKPADRFKGQTFDLVVTVCDDAAENCPVWLGQGAKAHIGFPDPAAAQGTDDQKMAVFRSVRDDIQAKILPFLESFTIPSLP